MKRRTDRETVEKIAAYQEETVSLLSNREKANLERAVCKAFLRCAGVSFSDGDVRSYRPDPPDVIFRAARFEVVIDLDPGRKLHGEWKRRAERTRGARSLAALMRRYKPAVPVPWRSVIRWVTTRLQDKAHSYGEKECARLDALVYVNRRGKFLDVASPLPCFPKLLSHGWGSVSVLMPPYACVLFARDAAPGFLHELLGECRREWPNEDPFELTPGHHRESLA